MTFGVFDLASMVAAVFTAWFWARQTLHRQRVAELESLADTRGRRVADLEREISELRERVSALEGTIAGLQSLKAREIALEVARLLGEEVGV